MTQAPWSNFASALFMKILAFIIDFATAKATRKSLELPDQEPEPLAHAPPESVELVAESAQPVPASAMPGTRAPAAGFKRLSVGL